MILVLLAIIALFWIMQTQVWNTCPVWRRDHVDRSVPFGLTLPVTWFQALDSSTVLLFAPFLPYVASIALALGLRAAPASPAAGWFASMSP